MNLTLQNCRSWTATPTLVLAGRTGAADILGFAGAAGEAAGAVGEAAEAAGACPLL